MRPSPPGIIPPDFKISCRVGIVAKRYPSWQEKLAYV